MDNLDRLADLEQEVKARRSIKTTSWDTFHIPDEAMPKNVKNKYKCNICDRKFHEITCTVTSVAKNILSLVKECSSTMFHLTRKQDKKKYREYTLRINRILSDVLYVERIEYVEMVASVSDVLNSLAYWRRNKWMI